MIMCPVCLHQEAEGTMFCSDCGTQLQDITSHATQNITTNGFNYAIEDIPHKKEKVLKSEFFALQILDGGRFLPLKDRNEFTIGRVSEGQPIVPDVDLTSYRAYEYGVSRIHALLKRTQNKVTITDLSSSNGTFVNGVRLAPDEEYPLSHGNIISLGKLKIQFLLQN